MAGGKPKFPQITGGKIFHEASKTKKYSNYKDGIQKNILQGENRKWPILQGGKTLLTLNNESWVVACPLLWFEEVSM